MLCSSSPHPESVKEEAVTRVFSARALNYLGYYVSQLGSWPGAGQAASPLHRLWLLSPLHSHSLGLCTDFNRFPIVPAEGGGGRGGGGS